MGWSTHDPQVRYPAPQTVGAWVRFVLERLLVAAFWLTLLVSVVGGWTLLRQPVSAVKVDHRPSR